jgi:hypothetical protein
MNKEDFNALRLTQRKMVQTHFQEPWQFKLVFDAESKPPSDFDIYVKDINYGSIEIQTDEIKAGMQTLTFPVGTSPVTLTMTMRDNQDRRIYKWFNKVTRSMVNDDGTVRLPKEYCRKVERINLVSGSIEDTWLVFPIRLGEVTESVESPGCLEFPITFIQFRSWGQQTR